MISSDKFKRLTEIDDKMLNDEPVTEDELGERSDILKEMRIEIDRAYIKNVLNN